MVAQGKRKVIVIICNLLIKLQKSAYKE